MFAQSVLGSSSHMRLQFALLYGFLLLFIAKPINTLSCYHPDGTRVDPSKKMIACNSTAEFTHCCADGDQCLTNGLCKAAADGRINSYWRESCTDPTWKSPACPHYCHDASIGTDCSCFWHEGLRSCLRSMQTHLQQLGTG